MTPQVQQEMLALIAQNESRLARGKVPLYRVPGVVRAIGDANAYLVESSRPTRTKQRTKKRQKNTSRPFKLPFFG